MNKVITINLNGVAYQLEEGGYDALRAYLDNAARRLEGNPDKDEIITDIEQAIADKFRALLVAYKTVVNTKEVTGVLAEMGPVEDGSAGAAPGAQAAAGQGAPNAGHTSATPESGGAKPLYRIREGAMIAGVCNGLATYTNIDVTFIRLGFTLLTLVWGVGALVYVIMAIIVPEAKTSAEKAAASGMAATTQEFIKRAREGYYEGMRSFHDRDARRAWKRKFRREMRGWKYGFHQQMNEHAHHWQTGWQGQPAPAHPPAFGLVFIAPLLSIGLFALTILMVWAIYSVVTAHAVFGFALPATMPLWVGILLVIVAYQLLAWPLKSVRLACYYPAPHPMHGGLLGGLIGSLIGLFFLGFGIWMLDRHVPEFHEWMVQLPVLLHKFADTVQGWFTQKG
jgi:phage shock protein PspC (stress-responsive transcriptional regulator)